MAKGKILNKFLSSGVQAFAVQVLGIIFFYFVSLYFSKENFGLISWANALCMFITTLLSFGLEQVVVRRIAVSRTSDWAAAAYLFHSFLGSLVLFIVILAVHFFFPQSDTAKYLPFFFAAQALIYVASPLKQYLNAREKFAPYGVIALLSNIGKIIAAILIAAKNELSIYTIAYVLIAAGIFEFICLLGYILSNPSFDFQFRFKLAAYKKLIKEGAPQYVAVIFDSGLSRMDWILLGIITTTTITAEYSFAYRAFEIARLPIAIVAPVILPRFAKLFANNSKLDVEKQEFTEHIFVLEMFVAVSFVLCLNILWTPVVSHVMHGKYGASNAIHFFILSLCIPLHFFINLLWTLCFAGKKYRSVSMVTIISAVCNLALNLALIPLFGGIGAAIAFLVTSIIQTAIYFFIVKREFTRFPVFNLVYFALIAFLAYEVSCFLTNVTALRLVFALGSYMTMCVLLRRVGKNHLNFLRRLVYQ